MSNKPQKIVSIIGIIVGIAIIVMGIILMDTSSYGIGGYIKFGADFYTEIYAVTRDVGHAINYAINNLIRTVSWLIIAVGAIDVCFFAYSLVKSSNAYVPNPSSIQSIDKNIQLLVTRMIRESEERDIHKEERDIHKTEESIGYEVGESAKREAEEKIEEQKQPPIKRDEKLLEKLAYALQFQTDGGMIYFLKEINDDSVQNILNSPTHLIRQQIQELLESLQ